jgi:RNA polymerase Rpb1, domain 1
MCLLGSIRALYITHIEAQIRKLSVKRIINPVTLDPFGHVLPDGLYDEAMGVQLNSHSECVTCKLSGTRCPGHFGHIELPVPVYNPLLLRYCPKQRFLECGAVSFRLVSWEVPRVQGAVSAAQERMPALWAATALVCGSQTAQGETHVPFAWPAGRCRGRGHATQVSCTEERSRQQRLGDRGRARGVCAAVAHRGG